MQKYMIDVERFKKEFGKYVDNEGLTIVKREIDPTPRLSELVIVESATPDAFRYDILRDGLKYWTQPFIVWDIGERVTGIKGIGDEYVWPVMKIEQMKARQRHVRGWHMKGPNIIAATAHDEMSPSTIYRNPIKAVEYHMFGKGEPADFASGTKGLFKELDGLGI